MDTHHFLVLDQGGHSSRALVFNAAGELLAQSAVAVETSTPQPGWVEQDPKAVAKSLLQSAHQVLDALPQELANSILSAALVTQRSSLVCWDRETGDALYPIISWQDRRAAQWLADQKLDEAEIHHRTGLRLSPHYGASKIRWCLDHVPAVREACLEKRLVCGPLACYLIAQLTGNKTPQVDPANASRTLLWNADSQSWDPWLLAAFGIPEQILPNIVATEHEFGDLPFDRKTLPLNLVNGDQSAALFATGALRPDTAYINIGTGAFVNAQWLDSATVPSKLLRSLVHKKESALYVVEGTVNAAATALDWAKDALGIQDISRLDQWAQQYLELPLFMNGVAGLGSPYWCDIATEFIGEGNEQQRMVAVLESVLFLLQVNLDLMKENEFCPTQVILTGGLSQLDSLCQKLADLSGLKVVRPKLIEASAQGAAYWLAGCQSQWDCRLGDTFTASAAGMDNINQRYTRWCQELNLRLPQV